ncbi:MAG TPA: lysylphosphatidylglycerol synthase domain-containing protein [Myxococcota bacterium]|jgi:uncharacterized membrane protein YbhN (UPF0104 family)
MKPSRQLLQRAIPAAVSLGLLAWLLSTFDLRAILAAIDARVAFVLVPSVLLWGGATLVLEALSIIRVLPAPPASFTVFTAARIKCASYLLGIIHLTLGGAGLAVLLRQRTGVTLGRSAGVVLLIMLTDLLITLSAGVLGASFSDAAASALPVGLLALLAAGLVFGVAILRAPGSLGPIERIRALPVFVALRETPLERLLELAVLRCVFVACFIAVGGSAFVAFGIDAGVPRIVVGMAVLAVVGALPIAVSGLGTGQVAAVYLFRDLAPPETILAMSLVLTFSLTSLRLLMGLTFAREFARQALAGAREAA